MNPLTKLLNAAIKNEDCEIFLDNCSVASLYGYVHKYQNANPKIKLRVLYTWEKVDYPIYYEHNDTVAFDSLNVSKDLENKSLLILRSMDALNNLINELI